MVQGINSSAGTYTVLTGSLGSIPAAHDEGASILHLDSVHHCCPVCARIL